MANRIERLIAKIERIEALSADVKKELEILNKESLTKAKKSSKKEVALPSETECRDELDKLYLAYLNGNPDATQEFIKNKTKEYLKVLCKANNLPANAAKMSKQHIIDEILRWFAQRKAISQDK